jgi:hypothetical protein
MITKIELRFLHTKALVSLWENESGYTAAIRFPYAVIEPASNNLYVEDILASTREKAAEMALFLFRERYGFLNKIIREIHSFNFFLHKAKFQKLTHRILFDERFTFLNEDYVYAISENVDGKKYFKTKFQRRSEIHTKQALLVINYDEVFKPMRAAGFRYNFIERLLCRYDKTPISKLRLYQDPVKYLIPPAMLKVNYIRDDGKLESFHNLVDLKKTLKPLFKPKLP